MINPFFNFMILKNTDYYSNSLDGSLKFPPVTFKAPSKKSHFLRNDFFV